MTNSREKFEAWVKHHLESLSGWEDFNVTEISHAAWIAGRESMRDEAANIAKFYAKNSATARHIVGAIQEIQP